MRRCIHTMNATALPGKPITYHIGVTYLSTIDIVGSNFSYSSDSVYVLIRYVELLSVERFVLVFIAIVYVAAVLVHQKLQGQKNSSYRL